jgi:CHAD domain-containing protein
LRVFSRFLHFLMANPDKWLSDIDTEDRVSKIARLAIRQRLKVARQRLKQAEGATDDDLEPVHQMRVSSRRAAAALRMFRELLPRRRARKLKRTLRIIRHLGGDARDCDLLIQSLSDTTTPETALLARRLRKQRDAAQRPIDRLKRRLIDHGELKRQVKKVLKRVDWRNTSAGRKEPAFRRWAKGQLDLLLAQLLEFDAASLQKDANLHQLRIAGKHLRYAAELAKAAFPQIATGRSLDQLIEMQDRLGGAADHLAAIARLNHLLDTSRAEERSAVSTSIELHQKQFALKKRKFMRWWTPTRKRTFESSWRAALRA